MFFWSNTDWYSVAVRVIVSTVLFCGFPMITAAQFNPEINYQAKLTDDAGVTVANGNYDIVFSLYTASSSGSAIWTESRTGGNQVTVTSGLFSVMLGDVSSLTSVDFSQTLYLGVTVGADSEMTPRKVLGAVPAAFVANTANELGGVASSSFLRSDAPDTATSFLNLAGGASVTDLDITGTATTTNLVVGSDFISDLTGAGLTITSNALTVATSTLGLGDGTFLGLTDTLSSFTANRLIFTNGAGDALTDSADLTFTGTALTVGGDILPSTNLTYNLGSSGARFANLWAETLNVGTSTWSIWNGSNGRLAFSNAAAQGGDERLTILTSGNIGIGTTTPSSKLDVWGNFRVGTSSTPALFANTANGRVGIGTTNPASALQVVGRITTDFLTATGSPTGAGVGDGAVYINPSSLSSAPIVQWTLNNDYQLNIACCSTSYVSGGDIDNDGDQDAYVIADSGGAVSAYENIGTPGNPAWSARADWNLPGTGFIDMELADINQDGLLDAIYMKADKIISVYLNTGTASSPTWATSTSYDLNMSATNAGSIAVADLDGNGLPDIAVTDVFSNFFYFNYGTATSASWSSAGGTIPNPTGNIDALHFADLDGDGDFDFIGNGLPYENVGNVSAASFVQRTNWNLPYGSRGGFLDADGDGDADFLDGTVSNYTYENTGSGVASSNTTFGIAVASTEKFRVDGAGSVFSTGRANFTYNGTAAAFYLRQNSTGDIVTIFDNSTEVFTILDGGNVGIGNANPSEKLDVTGNIALTGNILAEGDALIDGNVGIGTTTPSSALTVAGDVFITGMLRDSSNSTGTEGYVLQNTGTGFAWVATSTLGITGGGGSSLFTDDGATTYLTSLTDNLALGTTTATARLSIERTGYTGSGTIGVLQDLSVAQSAASQVAFANRTNISNTSTATTTIAGGFIRITDNTTFGNTIRGLEVQADFGSNTFGENTGISSFGRTFGLRGTTDASAGSVFEPAGVFAELAGVTQGNALRVYSGSVTSATLVNMLQESTVFTGTGLLMDFAQDAGIFSGNFFDLRNASTTQFSVASDGDTYIAGTLGLGTTTPSSKLSVAGDVYITGTLRDSSNSAGTSGFVLQSTGTGFAWVATSTLGISGGGASVSFGTDNQIPFMNSGGTDFEYSSNLVFDGTNVGIGTSSPTAKLHIYGGDILADRGASTGVTRTLTIGGAQLGSATDFARLDFRNWDNNDASPEEYVGARISSQNDAGSERGDLRFSTYRTGSLTERMIITAAGNVGIGDTAPEVLLTLQGVDGEASFSLESSDNQRVVDMASMVGDIGGLIRVYDGNLGSTAYISGSPTTATYFVPNEFKIGTTTAGTARLSIQSRSTSDILNLFETSGAEVLTVLESGDIGIGNSSPTALLDISSINNSNQLTDDTTSITRGISATTGVTDSDYVLNMSGSYAPTSGSTLLSGGVVRAARSPIAIGGATNVDVTGALALFEDGCTEISGICTSSADVVQIRQFATQNSGTVLNITSSSTNGGLVFRVNDDGTFTDASPFIINANGQVGAGTTSLNAKLTLQSQGTDDILNLFETSGAKVLTVLENGNVGIGTTSPSSLLQLYKASGPATMNLTSNPVSNSTIYFGDTDNDTIGNIAYSNLNNSFIFNTNGGSEELVITNIGNVGIGTTTPNSRLDVWGNLRVGTSSTPNLFVNSASNFVGIGTATQSGNTALTVSGDIAIGTGVISRSGGAGITLDADGSLRVQNDIYLSNGDQIRWSNARISGDNGSNLLNFILAGDEIARFSGTAGNFGLGDTSPDARFEISGNGLTTDELFMISSDDAADGDIVTVSGIGNVGIGTTTPGSRLTVSGTSAFTENLTLLGTTANIALGGNWLSGDGADEGVYVDGEGRVGVGRNSLDARLSVQGTSTEDIFNLFRTSGGQALTVLENGDVGIGISTPDAVLHVVGTRNILEYEFGVGTSQILATNNSTGMARFEGVAGNGGSERRGVMEVGLTEMTIGTISTNGSMPLQLQTNSQDRLTITTAGNVGIGTSTPDAKLTILGTTIGTDRMILGSQADTDGIINFTDFAGVSTDGMLALEDTFSVFTTDVVSGIGSVMDLNPGTNYTNGLAEGFTNLIQTRNGNANNLGFINGVFTDIRHGGSGTLTEIIGTYVTISNTGGGTITNTAAFYAGDVTSGTQTNTPYSFFAEDVNARNFFAGTTGFGGAGALSPARTVHIDGTMRLGTSVAVADNRTLCTIDTTGDIEIKDGACGTSALKYKENVEDLSYGLGDVRALNPVFFNYLTESDLEDDTTIYEGYDRTKRRIGFIAEEMQLIAPETVIWNDGEIDGIDYAYLTALLASGLQELDRDLMELLSTGTVGATSSLMLLTEEESVWKKLADLAAGFVDGVLTLTGLRTTEICLTDNTGETCIDRGDLQNLIEGGSQTASYTLPPTTTEPNSESPADTNTNPDPVENTSEETPGTTTATTTTETTAPAEENATTATPDDNSSGTTSESNDIADPASDTTVVDTETSTDNVATDETVTDSTSEVPPSV